MTQDKELEKRYKKEFRGHIFAMDDALMNWMLQFIQKQVALGQASAKAEMVKLVEGMISEQLKAYSNTPLDQRQGVWEELVLCRSNLLTALSKGEE